MGDIGINATTAIIENLKEKVKENMHMHMVCQVVNLPKEQQTMFLILLWKPLGKYRIFEF